ncbi:hypothetical protein BDN72DRAFT_884283 [Pluteus cervinus]|uniref:Uncharacterized protein n=1 Tax=Pluteus cervinus TaxID=181527 RepID=A0ACD2ZXV4_9AGAR|nr:hypothetical protein BDN72DRAFT_884283 [Pluteus cervinus]
MRSKATMLELQEQLDEEIQALEKRLLALRTSRNVLALVNQLSADLLTEILLWLQAPYMEFNSHRIMDWIRVTHVCRSWRSIAQNSKPLWTTLLTHHIAYAQLASQLSSPLPVTIIDTLNPCYIHIPEDTPKVFIPLLQRARKVVASGATSNLFLQALHNTSSELSCLQDIELDGVVLPLEASPFPKSLKRLNLSHSYFQWNWLKLEHLTELHLCNSKWPETTIDSFIDYMSYLPRLSYLEIQRGRLKKGPEVSHNKSNRHRHGGAAALTLKCLVIKHKLALITELLSHIKFKGNFTLEAELTFDDETPNEVVAFFRHVNRHLQASPRILRNCSLMHDMGDDVALSCSDRNESSPFLVIHTNYLPDEMLRPFLDSMQTLPFSRTQLLSTDAFPQLMAWQDCRFRLEKVQELLVRSAGPSYALIDLLATETESANRSHNWSSLSFPAITKLTLCGVQYSQEVMKKMISIFTGRAEHGIKVEELTFKDGSIADDGVRQLCQVVDKVTVT